ncbi:DUF294 nucleotidyltransferase-like domain-containing protein [Corynebacterium epidermidicanis]|uniref:Putative signal-transduction protein containing cAMP-binding and CBS domains n=1 Tax=Corynebacterium epidermidicanis TaxID=1050174 RepID=A0A0G3GP77_9CORY|nr:DUF294 nucleotidyltransferase-like domain-containing protein [Corynebacterium epidermidicanis]AKK02959.1 putative signal-transduction protein containing cAMP-binding and CBS domains [Corynebacterium epidermidicanis]
MTLELEAITDFLAQELPFSHLPAAALATLPQHMDMVYAKRETVLIETGQPNDFLYIIRSGAIDVLDSEGGLLDRRGVGSTFGYSTLNGLNASNYRMVAVEDSLLLRLPRAEFNALTDTYPWLGAHFAEHSQRIRAVADQRTDDTSAAVLRTKAREFLNPDPAVAAKEDTIGQAAAVMEEKNCSALLIMDQGRLAGIVTDRDLRRMVATGVNSGVPVAQLMTPQPRTIGPDTFAFEAMLVMAELGIHHLPVLDGNELCGVVSSASIVSLLRNNPMYLTAELSKVNEPADMAATFAAAEEIAVRLIERGATSQDVAGLLTVAADAVARRLLALAEEKLGPPPVPYCFVVVGSQGRRGMGLASDQDNCLVISDDYQPEHDSYFAQLSEFVCRGLDTAGQVLCPGDMMAMNPAWRMTTSQWISTFRQWITAPEPDALLHAQTFFDFRGIHGETSLAQEVHQAAVEMAQHAPRLHAHLAALAARREPPLSFFRGFVVERSGEYAQTLDVKKGGTAAVVQMARLYALAAGCPEVGTEERLHAAAGKSVSEGGARDLGDALEFLHSVSLRWQAEQLRRGERPSYHIDPKELSKSDRERLRDSFQVIKSMQTALATKFPVRST